MPCRESPTTVEGNRVFSAGCREQVVDILKQQIRIANFVGTSQEKDLTLPPNCEGFGRIHLFRRKCRNRWPDNPLPMDPACRALACEQVDVMSAQVFQCAVCNFRCWYCFVSAELLSAAPSHSAMLNASRLVELYANLPDPPRIIVLSGGNPELAPEWVLWMMKALASHHLDSQVYLWSDDNISNDYFWRCLSESDIKFIASYPNYGRVGCFKGFSSESFGFNTGADEELFDYQFEIMRRLLTVGIEIFAYVTFTTPSKARAADDVMRFMDRLQQLHPHLPLRTVPLEIKRFRPTEAHMNGERVLALEHQYLIAELWKVELERRYSTQQLNKNICDVHLS